MIRYYIPSDGDDPQHPNIFHLPSNISQPTLRDVRQHFPLPGSYHFRFKKKLGDTKVVWLDVIEDSAAIPNYEGIILAKVSRISMDGAKPTAAGNNVPTRSSGMRSQEHHSASSPATSEGSTTADLLNMGISSSPIRSSPASSSGGGTRQQASQPPPRPTASSPSIHQAPETDPFGLFASSSSSSMSQGRTTPPLGSSSPGIGGGGPPDLLNFDAFGAPRGSSMAGMGRGMPPPNMARGPSPMGGEFDHLTHLPLSNREEGQVDGMLVFRVKEEEGRTVCDVWVRYSVDRMCRWGPSIKDVEMVEEGGTKKKGLGSRKGNKWYQSRQLEYVGN